ncbi:MAG: hypothetical protein AUH86_03735 [Acidobacteria bacterium 13_1_40CM_4_58_4]|nr:MAG: hypothetical protein AUH86_03735 [Acidobacteria bacterium 13_1_40CM_4_58_4]
MEFTPGRTYDAFGSLLRHESCGGTAALREESLAQARCKAAWWAQGNSDWAQAPSLQRLKPLIDPTNRWAKNPCATGDRS